jgi:hypothetical protein
MRQWTAFAGIVTATLILALTISLLGSCQDSRRNDHVASNASQSHDLRVLVPQASWEPIFFREIDERAKLANLASLRTIVLPTDDLQIRIWFQAGYYGMDGIVLQRTSGAWAATYLYGFSKDPNFKKYEEQMQAPQSGWDIAWQRLVDSGLLTMPDASQVGCNVFGKDGAVFIVETNVKQTYRTYMYDNPAFAGCDEAKHMLKLIDTVNEEFRLEWPTTQ